MPKTETKDYDVDKVATALKALAEAYGGKDG